MNDQDLDNIYRQNEGLSHEAGLRGVFDAGYSMGANLNPPVQASNTVSAAQAMADTPTETQS